MHHCEKGQITENSICTDIVLPLYLPPYSVCVAQQAAPSHHAYTVIYPPTIIVQCTSQDLDHTVLRGQVPE